MNATSTVNKDLQLGLEQAQAAKDALESLLTVGFDLTTEGLNLVAVTALNFNTAIKAGKFNTALKFLIATYGVSFVADAMDQFGLDSSMVRVIGNLTGTASGVLFASNVYAVAKQSIQTTSEERKTLIASTKKISMSQLTDMFI